MSRRGVCLTANLPIRRIIRCCCASLAFRKTAGLRAAASGRTISRWLTGRKKDLLEALTLLPFRCIPLTPAVWQQYAADIYTLVGEIFSANPAYRPVPREQFDWLYDQAFAGKLCPHTSVLFQEPDTGRLVAMSFCLPDYQSLHLPPEASPVFARDYERLPRKTLLVKTVGVHPDYRRQGLMSFLGAYGMVHFQAYYEEVIFCLMRSDNFSLQFSQHLPHDTAHYALFGKSVS